jgi:hypothetical protein
MTESEWLVSIEPWKMLMCLDAKVWKRKLRLFAVACCRRRWAIIDDTHLRHAVEIADRWADHACTGRELRATKRYARAELFKKLNEGVPNGGIASAVDSLFFLDVYTAANTTSHVTAGLCADVEAEYVAQASELRDIVGNPLRAITHDSSFLTNDVIALAQNIYDTRAFERLPSLAKAIKEAGGDEREVLDHCHQSKAHVRGCWVIDLVLGKA